MGNKSCIYYKRFAFHNETAVRDYLKNKNLIQQEIGNLLLNHEKIAFEVNGANLPVVILLDIFGLSGLQKLLEQNAVEFLFTNAETVCIEPEQSKENAPLRMLGKLSVNDLMHQDPEESLKVGLSTYKNFIDRKEKRNLSRKIIKQYKVLPNNLVDEVIKFTSDGYNNNLFENNDLPNLHDIREISKEELKKLHEITKLSVDYSIISKYQYNTLNAVSLMKLNKAHSLQLNKANIINSYSDKAFNIEGLPNFKELIAEGAIGINDILNLREKAHSQKFRNWLNNLDETKLNDFDTKEYIDEITKKHNFLCTDRGKLLRTLGVFTISKIITAPLNPIAAIPVELGLTLVDAYCIDSYIQGWNPRYFFDEEIKPILK